MHRKLALVPGRDERDAAVQRVDHWHYAEHYCSARYGGHGRQVLEQEAGKEPCGVSQTDSFFPGSPIDFTLKLKEKADAYHTGCFDTFNMKS
jgi:hypothetical protein